MERARAAVVLGGDESSPTPRRRARCRRRARGRPSRRAHATRAAAVRRPRRRARTRRYPRRSAPPAAAGHAAATAFRCERRRDFDGLHPAAVFVAVLEELRRPSWSRRDGGDVRLWQVHRKGLAVLCDSVVGQPVARRHAAISRGKFGGGPAEHVVPVPRRDRWDASGVPRNSIACPSCCIWVAPAKSAFLVGIPFASTGKSGASCARLACLHIHRSPARHAAMKLCSSTAEAALSVGARPWHRLRRRASATPALALQGASRRTGWVQQPANSTKSSTESARPRGSKSRTRLRRIPSCVTTISSQTARARAGMFLEELDASGRLRLPPLRRVAGAAANRGDRGPRRPRAGAGHVADDDF